MGFIKKNQGILIIGHGVAGKTLAENLERQGINVAGFLDDNSDSDLVLGKIDSLTEFLQLNPNVYTVFIAITSLPFDRLNQIVKEVIALGRNVASIPASAEVILKGKASLEDLTDIDILSILGRQVKEADFNNLGYLRSKKILVTGAAGSIGSEIVRQLTRLGVSEIVAVDISENGLFRLQELIETEIPVHFLLRDLKQKNKVIELFSKFQPDVVIHAAAHKHVPLMEKNVVEAIENNIGGFINLIEAVTLFPPKNFVLISTDKAVNPKSVMGATKRACELLTNSLATMTPNINFQVVRFGNVIQSNGSVMETFRRQLNLGIPLSVTDKNVTRYFMTIGEACNLVLQVPSLSDEGLFFILDMGQPFRIYDLAINLCQLYSHAPGVKIIGLRPGEKLQEELNYDIKEIKRSKNKKIFVANVSYNSSKNYDQELLNLLNSVNLDPSNVHEIKEKLFSSIE